MALMIRTRLRFIKPLLMQTAQDVLQIVQIEARVESLLYHHQTA